MKEEWQELMAQMNQNQLSTLTGLNDYTKKFGVSLSKQEAEELLTEQKNSLKEHGRIEFGGGIIEKLIYAFCDSPYIYQDNYVKTLAELQEIFYLYKNESLDEVTDDELLEYMKKHFDGDCHGSLEYLEETCLEQFAREVRQGTRRFIGKYRVKYEEI